LVKICKISHTEKGGNFVVRQILGHKGGNCVVRHVSIKASIRNFGAPVIEEKPTAKWQ